MLTSLLLVLHLLVLQRTIASSLHGMNLDYCLNNDHCRPPRNCVELRPRGIALCTGNHSAKCRCMPPRQLPSCNITNPCPNGERCVATRSTRPVCMSCSSPRHPEHIFVLPNESCPPSPSPLVPPGLSLDPCTSDADCIAPRSCITTRDDNSEFLCSPSDKICFCKSPVHLTCNDSSSCPAAERCARFLRPGEPCDHTPTTAQPRKPTGHCLSCHSVHLLLPRVCYLDVNPPNCARPPTSVTTTYCSSSGKSFSVCCTNDDCIFPRTCTSASKRQSQKECLPNERNCFCALSKSQSCGLPGNPDCPSGERCIFFKNGNTCMACHFVRHLSDFKFVDDGHTCESTSPSPSPIVISPTPTSTPVSNSRLPPGTNPTASATAIPSMPVSPAQSGVAPNPSRTASNVPLSTSAEASSSPRASGLSSVAPSQSSSLSSPTTTESPEVCIAVIHLKHLPANELVFRQHQTSHVLCDVEGSCATSGHIVMWRGRVMTMRRYCNAVDGCVGRVLAVNSPRMRAAVRVASRTDGLMFTALSARWHSWIEEMVMSMIVRLGL